MNPGSATGAFTTTAASWAVNLSSNGEGQKEQDKGFDEDEEVVPSFCLMDVQGISLTLYVYQLRRDEKGVENVAVEKVTYTKPVEPTGAGGAAAGAGAAASGAASVSSS